MLKFAYVTGQDVWIAPQHIVSIRSGVENDQPFTLLRTVNGDQFAVKGTAAEVATYFDEVEVDA